MPKKKQIPPKNVDQNWPEMTNDWRKTCDIWILLYDWLVWTSRDEIGGNAMPRHASTNHSSASGASSASGFDHPSPAFKTVTWHNKFNELTPCYDHVFDNNTNQFELGNGWHSYTHSYTHLVLHTHFQLAICPLFNLLTHTFTHRATHPFTHPFTHRLLWNHWP